MRPTLTAPGFFDLVGKPAWFPEAEGVYRIPCEVVGMLRPVAAFVTVAAETYTWDKPEGWIEQTKKVQR